MTIPPLSKSYGGVTVLHTPAMEMEPVKIYAVIGANGSCKSTLSKLLSGAVKSDGGEKLRGVRVGYMPQKSYAFRMSTRANVLLGGGDRDNCERLMDALQIGHLADKGAHRLSGGETARMALARLLMGSYDLLILDEPTAAMDMESTILSEELIRDYVNNVGCAVLLVTHSLQQAKRLADRVLFLQKGELVEQGDAATLLTAPKDARTRAFLDFYGLS